MWANRCRILAQIWASGRCRRPGEAADDTRTASYLTIEALDHVVRVDPRPVLGGDPHRAGSWLSRRRSRALLVSLLSSRRSRKPKMQETMDAIYQIFDSLNR